MNRLLAYVAAHSTVSELTDGQLLHRFASERDEAAFSELVRRHGPLVWGVCRRNLWNTPDAEDAFQAAFLVLVRRASELVSRPHLGPWLYKVAVCCCRNARRGNQRRLRRLSLGLSEDLPAREGDQELHPALDAAVLSLPEKYRVPIVLCHLQGMSRRQVAQFLGCPEGTLSARLSRALAKLRVKLANRDPAALLAIGGALAAPATVANAAVRAGMIYSTATGAVSQAVMSTSDGVLRMFRVKKLRLATAALFAMLGVVLVGAKLAAGPDVSDSPPPAKTATPQATQQAPAPALMPGKWSMIQWQWPTAPNRAIELKVSEKDGKAEITSVSDELENWVLKEAKATRDGRHIVIEFTRDRVGSSRISRPIIFRFDGLVDPNDPSRILGSFCVAAAPAIRAQLEYVPATGLKNLSRTEPPELWRKYQELSSEYQHADAMASVGSDKKPPAELAELRAKANAAKQKYDAEGPALLRKLIAEHAPGPFAHQAAMELFGMLDQVKPKPSEIDEWIKAARQFAIEYGPQFEADTIGQIALKLTRDAGYASQARAYAAEADRLAETAGMVTRFGPQVASFDEERAAWAGLPNPPKDGSFWTVSIGGRVVDSKGDPVAGADVFVNNTQWVHVVMGDGSWKTKTGPDGRYSITLNCQGSYRVHVTRMSVEKKGFVRSDNHDRHKLLPGQTATVDFTLIRGEPFGGVLKLLPNSAAQQLDHSHFIEITGPGVREFLNVKNGKKFELTLPPGEYSIDMDRFGKSPLHWSGLKTGATDHVLEEPPFRFTPESVGEGFDKLWTAMDYSYSYFAIKPDVDWGKLKEEFRPKAIQAKSADELAKVLQEMLGKLKDGHVWIMTPDGNQIGTHRILWNYNGNRKVILDQLTDTTQCGDFAIVGKTKPDGFGYFFMTHQSAATAELVKKAIAAIEKLSDAPGFIVDLRNANGGNELLAQQIAQRFCDKKVIYAKSRYRNGKEHDNFGQDQPRWLMPSKSGKPYLNPVVCLLGPGCVSSGEGFAKMMKALPNVTTVGLPTRGSSGNPGPIEVGETGLTVYFSRWVDMLPDGTPIEGKGVPPSVRVERPLSEYRDADPTLAKALELLREELSGKK
jgi:RNA polymerase sigma factor (sigma-70 family)